jgi:hypothetical protein
MSGALRHRSKGVLVELRRVVVVVVEVLALLVAHASPAGAVVSASAARTELLYSSEADIDCSKLFKITDDLKLPRNVARIRAVASGARDPAQVRFRWSMQRKGAGTLAADLDLGPLDQTSAVSGMCADFGNACSLTEDRLRFYDEPSILWVAPTCGILPTNTSKPYRGGTVKIGVKAFEGRRRLGRATVTLGFGRDGTVTLFAWNGRLRDDRLVMEDGIGKSQVGVPVNVLFGATTAPPADAPGPIKDFVFDNGGGGKATVDPGCSIPTTVPLDACETVPYGADGRFRPTVAARFEDKSALCDAMTTTVNNCHGDIRIDAIPDPKRSIYDANDPSRSTVHLIVRVTNTSKPGNDLPACNLFFEGAGVLSCQEEFKAGELEDKKNTTFALQHCSRSQGRGCDFNGQCRPPICDECEPDEVCLTESHCSETFVRKCRNDFDCDNTGSPAPCAECKDGETCVRILPFGSSVFLVPGDSLNFIDTTAVLRNELGTPARMRDTWTVNASIPALSDQDLVKYRIKPRRQ